MKSHQYSLELIWTGNTGEGTAKYSGYSRDHQFNSAGKPVIGCSSDPVFRGDPLRYNPEELLVAAVASCHMLWYLHFCSENLIVVVGCKDKPVGIMHEQDSGSGKFSEVVLHPTVTISSGDAKLAEFLHERAHAFCFIAQSLNFPVRCEGDVLIAMKAER